MKRKSLLIIGTFLSLVAVMNMGISKIQKGNSNFMQNLLTEAKADGEGGTVTCASDPGDACVVGGTTIQNYDEACGTWFWG